MQDPKIISTNTTRSAMPGPPPKLPGFSASDPDVASESRSAVSRPAALRRPLNAHPVVLGLLFLGAGCFVWSMLSEKNATVPKAWLTGGVAMPTPGLRASVRSGGPGQGDLLRLEWPEHPKAESYTVQFQGANGFETAPISVLGSIFLYDLKSDVFNLPEAFRWTVTAVMADGTQVTGPPSSFSRAQR